MEARPPAENRHGGAPRGERPASWDAPRLTRADPSRLANATTEIVRLSALRPPLLASWGWTRSQGQNPGATTRRGNEETALFDIVNRIRPTVRSRAATSHASCARPLSCPGRAESRDPGPRAHDGSGGVELARLAWARSRISLARSLVRAKPGSCDPLAQERSLHSPGTRERRKRPIARAPAVQPAASMARLRRTPASPRPRTAAWISAPRARRARRN